MDITWLPRPTDAVIDLHSHSLASDGQYRGGRGGCARRGGRAVWGLCDHDTVAGLPEAARQAAERKGSGSSPASSCRRSSTAARSTCSATSSTRSTPALKRFEDFLAVQRRVGWSRSSRSSRRSASGSASRTSRSTAAARPSGGPTSRAPSSRPASVATVKEAFDRFLGEGRPAYVQRYRLEADEAVRLVRAAGGTTTVAHPG